MNSLVEPRASDSMGTPPTRRNDQRPHPQHARDEVAPVSSLLSETTRNLVSGPEFCCLLDREKSKSIHSQSKHLFFSHLLRQICAAEPVCNPNTAAAGDGNAVAKAVEVSPALLEELTVLPPEVDTESAS